jgi:hypothetical protein
MLSPERVIGRKSARPVQGISIRKRAFSIA